ncbi:2-dehydro-3-deoxygalactonokinase [Paracoccus alkanivorans]|uniref:2-dehydro-3-deoxygalactonokinase n=1 Tax=Paracoccus alkanivorans TaxID=2116655 RepID=A0A3M0MFP3_9RHOB|nr:2-dehydro-3-deoxygalactonokinase [Paracoccus alkanivorans]RMC36498.1 hypothetical protein C9E81_07530 [Paracoccus alkanivorans]
MSAPNWIAAEYDGARLRFWSMQGAGICARQEGACTSMAALTDALKDWPDLPVLLADLTGEFPAPGAAAPVSAALRLVQGSGGARPLWLAQGVTQATPAGALHGQTAAIAGLLKAEPQFDGVICLPGRRSHWVRISASEICHFHGYMTGELLVWLGSPHSSDAASDPDAFFAAFEDALSRPHRAYGRLLALRGAKGAEASQLAGLLIGIEMADAKPYWLGERVAVTGHAPLADLYAAALERQGVSIQRPDPDAALLAGLHAAWKSLPVNAAKGILH